MQDTGAISQSDIRQFEVEVEMTSGEKRDYEYEVDDGREKAKVESRASDASTEANRHCRIAGASWSE